MDSRCLGVVRSVGCSLLLCAGFAQPALGRPVGLIGRHHGSAVSASKKASVEAARAKAVFGSYSATVDNTYRPYQVGAKYIFGGTGGNAGYSSTGQVLSTDTVDGIACVKVKWTTTQGAAVLDEGYEWYAQDASGTVWLLRTFYDSEYDDDDYLEMPAGPAVGDEYALWCELVYRVISLSSQYTVPAGTFSNCLHLFSDDESWVYPPENEYYAPGVGLIYEADAESGAELKSYSGVSFELVIDTASPLPPGTVGKSYSLSFSATGGAQPYSWSLASGSLPAGLKLSAGGDLSGKPGAAAVASFSVRATDSAGKSVTKAFTLTTQEPSALPRITTESPLATGVVGRAYSQALGAAGGTAPYTWSVVSGSLPNGVDLSADGVISGTPTEAGEANFAVQVIDADGQFANRVFDLTVRVNGYALIVGLSNYYNGYVTQLTWAVNNAIDVRSQVLKSPSLWQADQIKELIDGDATKDAIRRSLTNLASVAVAGDVVLYYHSGHGGQRSGTDTLLCVYDTHYEDDDLAEDLNAFRSGVSVIVIVDACHSAGMFKEAGADSPAEWAFARNVTRKMQEARKRAGTQKKGADVGWITSSDFDQVSTGFRFKNGFFTKYLIEGFFGGDDDSDGWVSFGELYRYAEPRTKELARDRSHDLTNQYVQAQNTVLLNSTFAKQKAPTASPQTIGSASSLSVPDAFEGASDLSVKGLPAGLKFDTATQRITGVPTQAGTYAIVFSAADVGVQTVTVTVASLPAWAQGAFNGYLAAGGSFSMSVTAAGKLSGKIALNGTNYAFSASSYAAGGEGAGFWVEAQAKAGKALLPVALTVLPAPESGAASLGVAAGALDGAMPLAAYRNVWKDVDAASLAQGVAGYYTAALAGGAEYGSGYLTLTLDKAGKVKAAGKLADGTAVSQSGTLLLDEGGRLLAALYAAPPGYKGGSLFGVAELVRPDAGGVYLRPLDGAAFLWSSRNPAATEVYGAGFERPLPLSGGWYSKTDNLYGYYQGLDLAAWADAGAPAPELTVGSTRYASAWWNPAGVALTPAASASGVMTGLTAPAAGKPTDADGDGAWDYGAQNVSGLKIALARPTGIFKGTFLCWFDYPEEKHVSKSVSFEGALTPVRENPEDGVEGRGYFLWADKAAVPATGKVYPFKWSYDLIVWGADVSP